MAVLTGPDESFIRLWESAVDFSRFFLLVDGTGNLAILAKDK